MSVHLSHLLSYELNEEAEKILSLWIAASPNSEFKPMDHADVDCRVASLQLLSFSCYVSIEISIYGFKLHSVILYLSFNSISSSSNWSSQNITNLYKRKGKHLEIIANSQAYIFFQSLKWTLVLFYEFLYFFLRILLLFLKTFLCFLVFF